MKHKTIGDFKVKITHIKNSEHSHRYYIECIDNQYLVTMYRESNIVDLKSKITIEEAIKRINAYFKERFGINLIN